MLRLFLKSYRLAPKTYHLTYQPLLKQTQLLYHPLRLFTGKNELINPDVTSDDEDSLMVEEAQIVQYQEAGEFTMTGSAGSTFQVKPFDPPKLQEWIMQVHSDPETKQVKLKYGL